MKGKTSCVIEWDKGRPYDTRRKQRLVVISSKADFVARKQSEFEDKRRENYRRATNPASASERTPVRGYEMSCSAPLALVVAWDAAPPVFVAELPVLVPLPELPDPLLALEVVLVLVLGALLANAKSPTTVPEPGVPSLPAPPPCHGVKVEFSCAVETAFQPFCLTRG